MKPLLFCDLSTLSTLRGLDISGYHTNSVGITDCYFNRSGEAIHRVERKYLRDNPGTFYVALSSVRSPFWMLYHLISKKVLSGEIVPVGENPSKALISTHIQNYLSKGMCHHDIVLANLVFKNWHGNVKTKFKQIVGDRIDFKKSSEYTESLHAIKETIKNCDRGGRLGHDRLRQALDQAYDEHIIEGVFDA